MRGPGQHRQGCPTSHHFAGSCHTVHTAGPWVLGEWARLAHLFLAPTATLNVGHGEGVGPDGYLCRLQ